MGLHFVAKRRTVGPGANLFGRLLQKVCARLHRFRGLCDVLPERHVFGRTEGEIDVGHRRRSDVAAAARRSVVAQRPITAARWRRHIPGRGAGRAGAVERSRHGLCVDAGERGVCSLCSDIKHSIYKFVINFL